MQHKGTIGATAQLHSLSWWWTSSVDESGRSGRNGLPLRQMQQQGEVQNPSHFNPLSRRWTSSLDPACQLKRLFRGNEPPPGHSFRYYPSTSVILSKKFVSLTQQIIYLSRYYKSLDSARCLVIITNKECLGEP